MLTKSNQLFLKFELIWADFVGLKFWHSDNTAHTKVFK